MSSKLSVSIHDHDCFFSSHFNDMIFSKLRYFFGNTFGISFECVLLLLFFFKFTNYSNYSTWFSEFAHFGLIVNKTNLSGAAVVRVRAHEPSHYKLLSACCFLKGNLRP